MCLRMLSDREYVYICYVIPDVSMLNDTECLHILIDVECVYVC